MILFDNATHQQSTCMRVEFVDQDWRGRHELEYSLKKNQLRHEIVIASEKLHACFSRPSSITLALPVPLLEVARRVFHALDRLSGHFPHGRTTRAQHGGKTNQHHPLSPHHEPPLRAHQGTASRPALNFTFSFLPGHRIYRTIHQPSSHQKRHNPHAVPHEWWFG